MATKSDVRKLPTVADTHTKLDAQQQLLSSREDRELNSAVAGGQSDHSLMKKMILEKNKTFKNTGSQEILQNVQNSLSSSPMSSLGPDYSNLSGPGAHTSSSANMRRKKTAGQGETVTAKASPATVRKEQTAAQGERPGKATPTTMRKEQTAAQGERPGKDTPTTMRKEQTAAQGERPGKATPTTMRKEQTAVQGERPGKDTPTATKEQTSAQGERTMGKAGPATTRKEQIAVQNQRPGKATPTTAKKEPISTQGGERTIAMSNPTSMRVERSKNLSGGNAIADPNLKVTAPAKPARSSKVKSKPDMAGQGSLLEQNRGVGVNPNAEHNQLPEHAENTETAGKLPPPTPPSAKLKPRPPPFSLQEPSQTEPKGEEVEGFIVAADLESPPESPKAKPDNVIARQLSEQAEEEGIFYKKQESVGAKSPEDAYTAEMLADPKLRQLHDMFPGEQVSHLQKLLEKNKGELEKTVAVLIGESSNSSDQQTPGIPPEDDVYDDGEHMPWIHQSLYHCSIPLGSTMEYWTALQYSCVCSVVNAIGFSLFAPMRHHFNINLCITDLY